MIDDSLDYAIVNINSGLVWSGRDFWPAGTWGLDEVVAEGTALEQHAEIGAVKGHRSALRGGATWPCLFCLLYNL